MMFGVGLTAVLLALHSVLFIVGHRTGHWNLGLLERVNLGEDLAAPTWIACAVLAACAAAALLIWKSSQAAAERWGAHWLGMAALFFLASLDEIARLHEWMGEAPALRGRSGVLNYGWVIGGIALLGLTFLAYFPFLRALDRRTRNLMVLSAAVYFSGALLFEMLNAWTAERMTEDSLRYALQTGVEESFEFLGAFLFLFTLLDVLERRGTRFLLWVEGSGGGVGAPTP